MKLAAIAGQLLAVGGFLAVSIPTPAFAQTVSVCGPEVKAEVAKALSAVDGADDDTKARTENELYAKYQYCVQDAAQVPASFIAAARECGAAVSNLGSIFFEEMSCAGYDPQRRQFAAPIKIKQTFGYGGAPLPGSREYVLHCVADPAGVLRPVGQDSVHPGSSTYRASVSRIDSPIRRNASSKFPASFSGTIVR